MSSLSWNCRGLGNPQTVDELVTLVGKKDPNVVFLMETKSMLKLLRKFAEKSSFLTSLLFLDQTKEVVWPYCGKKIFS